MSGLLVCGRRCPCASIGKTRSTRRDSGPSGAESQTRHLQPRPPEVAVAQRDYPMPCGNGEAECEGLGWKHQLHGQQRGI